MSDIDRDIEARASTHPRVTLADIERLIIGTYFFTGEQGARCAMADDGVLGAGPLADATPLGLLTICVLVLANGYTVIGTSACVSPQNFDRDIGQRVAKQAAIAQVWPLLGYQLREQLHRGVSGASYAG